MQQHPLKLRLQEPAIAAIGQLAVTQVNTSDDGLASAIKALKLINPDGASNQVVTGRSSSGIAGLSPERVKTLKLENLEAILRALQGSSDEQDRDKINAIIAHYLISELTIDIDGYRVENNINKYFEAEDLDTPKDLGSIRADAFNSLEEGLRQEAERIVEAYQREFRRIPEDLKDDFRDTSSSEYEVAKQRRREALRKDYTAWLEQRARELRAYDEAFRDDVLKVLVSLESDTISGLPHTTRQSLIQNLGLGERPEAMAQQCLSAEDDLFTQERLCHGLSKLLAAALTPPPREGRIDQAQRETSIDFLQTLAGGEETNFNLERPSPIIRSTAIEYLGDLSDFDVSYTSAQDLQPLLLARLAAGDEEPGVIENAIQTYLLTDPIAGVRELKTTLVRGSEAQQVAATEMLARLGREAYANVNNPVGNPVSVADRSGGGFAYAVNAESPWQAALQDEALVAALISIVEDTDNADSLRANTISAIGGVRPDDEAAVTLLRNALLDADQEEMRVAAAYALGNIGQVHEAIGDELLSDLYTLVTEDTTASDELRVIAAYSLTKIGISHEESFENVNRHAIAFTLIALFDQLESTIAESDTTFSPTTQRAIILYALSQLEVSDEKIAQVFADGLASDEIAVKTVAAAHAKSLLLWNENLAEALIEALEDPNIAVRSAAVESIRLRQEGALRGLHTSSAQFSDQTTTEDAEASKLTYEELFVEALVAVFWNENEYGFIRLSAGRALNGVLDSNEQIILNALDLNLEAQEFVDLLTALESLDTFSANFRAPITAAGGSDAILQTLRSTTLLNEFDDILEARILIEILEAIRSDTEGSHNDASRLVEQSSPPPACSWGWLASWLPRCG